MPAPRSPSPKAPAAARPRRRVPKSQPEEAPRPYHHGDLPGTLLAAAERVLRREGIAGLGLRAIAREAGVSHTAPKHHFGDTAGLLSELAAAGFWRLRAAMLHALPPDADAQARRQAIGLAYVDFAHANPALFGLMFRNEKLDEAHPGLVEARTAAMRVMAGTINETVEAPAGQPVRLSGEQAMRVAGAWAVVHGLATLLIDGRLRGVVKTTDAFATPLALAHAVLQGR